MTGDRFQEDVDQSDIIAFGRFWDVRNVYSVCYELKSRDR
jgi:hypothetical protein